VVSYERVNKGSLLQVRAIQKIRIYGTGTVVAHLRYQLPSVSSALYERKMRLNAISAANYSLIVATCSPYAPVRAVLMIVASDLFPNGCPLHVYACQRDCLPRIEMGYKCYCGWTEKH
jgi:hypothetical protein